MGVDRGMLVFLEAQPGKEDELAAFLEQARALAAAENGTVTWYAFRLGNTSYGIFDTFANEDDRDAHLSGRIPAALAAVGADLLDDGPEIRQLDIIAVK